MLMEKLYSSFHYFRRTWCSVFSMCISKCICSTELFRKFSTFHIIKSIHKNTINQIKESKTALLYTFKLLSEAMEI